MSYLSLQGVCKSFGTFKALDDVTLHAEKGSVVAVLGENGAGKTTLMNVLYGLYRPDSGQISVAGQPVVLHSPRDAIGHRIGMIHQHFHLAGALTVAQNILVGLHSGATVLDLPGHERRIARLSEDFGFEIDVRAPVWKLPMGMRQRTEILKALYRRAEILVLDEPTSVLAPDEIAALLESLKRLKAAGTTILFVTHKLDEVFSAADQVVVMRAGKVVMSLPTAETTARELSQRMVGRDVAPVASIRHTRPGEILLRFSSVSARNDRGVVALDGISFALRRGEVLGISGVDGNGQKELAEVVAGLRTQDSGRVELDGKDLAGSSIRERTHTHRIGFVPEDRHTTGLVLSHPVWKNFFLRGFYRRPLARRGLLDQRRMREDAHRLARQYDCRLRSIEQPAAELSGGNQQKIILAREIEAKPQLLIVMQATKGLDIGAIEFVQRKLLEQRDAGVAILYISTELEHVLEIADRVAVMYRGRITGELTRAEVTPERMGMLMSGVAEEPA
ncbi:MAG TPA: ABC transporter ATP-binding protein [Burkholderiaceae bacterium]|nr:ABC transporter ATP-binding protein [Burkholderiaceae bacterium]